MNQEMIRKLRMYLMDSLLAKVNCVIEPNVIGQITDEFVSRCGEMIEDEEE